MWLFERAHSCRIAETHPVVWRTQYHRERLQYIILAELFSSVFLCWCNTRFDWPFPTHGASKCACSVPPDERLNLDATPYFWFENDTVGFEHSSIHKIIKKIRWNSIRTPLYIVPHHSTVLPSGRAVSCSMKHTSGGKMGQYSHHSICVLVISMLRWSKASPKSLTTI